MPVPPRDAMDDPKSVEEANVSGPSARWLKPEACPEKTGANPASLSIKLRCEKRRRLDRCGKPAMTGIQGTEPDRQP